ncbi:hypothetical protein [uncultured Roseobacter sp.]|uniref:hypothetical protein n=1 Tax=uncultured Roseobacter sp. TaxID=114847 RepID=UPI002628D9E7|nr:hypothetical protein [uncultured Roseobacter sp.]
MPKNILIGAAMSSIILSGCAVNPDNAYPKAQSMDQCYSFAVAEQKRRRASAASAPVNTGSSELILASLVGNLIGTSASYNSNKRRLNQCVARFGGTQDDIDAITAQRRSTSGPGSPVALDQPASHGAPTAQITAGCPRGASVLHGGSGYC